MTAKHKRPFFVFTVVAVICGMVLITGVRSKADMSRAPDVFSATVAAAGPPLSPLFEPSGGSTIAPDPETDTGTRAQPLAASVATDPGQFAVQRAGDGSPGSSEPFSGFMPGFTVPSSPDELEVPGTDPGSREDDGESKGGKSSGTRGKDGKGGQNGDKEDEDEGDEGVNGPGLPGQHLEDVDLPDDMI